MRITTVTVSAQRKLPHPTVDFASVSALVSLTADLDREDDVTRWTTNLQHKAELLVEEHLEHVVRSLSPKPKLAVLKAQEATANTAASLAEKHGAKV